MEIQADQMTPSERVLEAVADAKSTDELDLHPPLGEVINPDALNTLLTDTGSSTLEVTFHYSGYEVTLHPDGTLDVQEL